MIKTNIFKAYDIRGFYPQEVNKEAAFKLGIAFTQFLRKKTNKRKTQIVVGQDSRLSSSGLFKSFCQGAFKELVSTDLLYFVVSCFKYTGGVMITASHNPKNYNGFKLLAQGPKFISQDWGMNEIKRLINRIENIEDKNKNIKGKIIKKDFLNDYIKYIFKKDKFKNISHLKAVIDVSHGTSGKIIKELQRKLKFTLFALNFKPDGRFPCHSPNPKIEKNLIQAKREILKQKADFGLVFDGDGDRVVFLDNKGRTISAEIIMLLFSKYLLKNKKNFKMVYTLNCSRIIPEMIKKWGGKAIKSKVGRSFVREKAVKNKAIISGEKSGHILYKDFFYNECGGLSLVLMLKILSLEKRILSELIKGFKKYYQLEKNIKIKIIEKERMIKKIEKFFPYQKKDYLDGLTIEFKDWWFNARFSNTEPLLRLNLEADNKKIVQEKLEQIEKILRE